MDSQLAALSEERSGAGHRTLAEKAFQTLHTAIITGQLAPGTRLPIEELADVMAMSPMPIREALRQLDSVGLVENIPHRGARVTELSIEDLHEVYDARLALEPLAVRIGAENFTGEDAARARGLLEEHVRAYGKRDLRLIWSTHTAFHVALYNTAHSKWLSRLIHPLWETSERYRFAMLPVRVNLDQRRVEHERILEACISHEPEVAAAELHNHLAATANLIADQMGGKRPFGLVEVPPRAAVA
jgi:DNA-binding GntR family transcriptional regulator